MERNLSDEILDEIEEDNIGVDLFHLNKIPLLGCLQKNYQAGAELFQARISLSLATPIGVRYWELLGLGIRQGFSYIATVE